MKEVIYGVWRNDQEFINGDNDMADWFNSCDEALESAQDIVSESGEISCIMKFSDGESEWDAPITVEPDGRAWSDDWNAREEMGCVQ